MLKVARGGAIGIELGKCQNLIQWTGGDLNPLPQQCECCALPDELTAHLKVGRSDGKLSLPDELTALFEGC